MDKKELKLKIKKILNDTKFWEIDMIIEEKEPCFWRIHPKWLEEKAQKLWVLFLVSTLVEFRDKEKNA